MDFLKVCHIAGWTKEITQDAENKSFSIFENIRRHLTGPSLPHHFNDSLVYQFKLKELPNEYVIFINVAGIPPDSIRVQVARNQLFINGEHKECSGRACWERSIEETIDLPNDVLQDDIECHVHLQILILKVPRNASFAERKVQVEQEIKF